MTSVQLVHRCTIELSVLYPPHEPTGRFLVLSFKVGVHRHGLVRDDHGSKVVRDGELLEPDSNPVYWVGVCTCDQEFRYCSCTL